MITMDTPSTSVTIGSAGGVETANVCVSDTVFLYLGGGEAHASLKSEIELTRVFRSSNAREP